MLYDLNIAWSATTSPSDLEHTLKFAKNLGYDVVALNHIINSSIPTQPTPIINPIPQLTPPHPSYPAPNQNTRAGTTTNLSTTAASTTPSSSSEKRLPTVLRRVTLVITDPATTNYRLLDFARAYDLLTLRPTNEKAFSWACLSTTEPPALISLDLSTSLGYHIHHRTAMAAVHRGTRFEICYSQAIGSGIDARARSQFIGNVLGLLRATKGRGIVVSSEARSALGLRAPADVVNLMAVWGLGPERGTEALGVGARAVVVNEGIKRRGFRGIVDIVKPAEGGPTIDREETGNDGREGKIGKQERNKQQQGQQKQQQKNQKRKNGEGSTGGGGGQDGQGGMSKRQAKKMKKELVAKG
ncbi:RNase P subunit p30-domain-containing protein [Apodospora peruviana]|uniref:RNase P subunit p30-domain-containing protein n=1 Tax=Apodospora peruviana TaxID=516989 RepID=A0AAE0ME50_9PEZI|nr:RNase P subunit p30-domain-containing protein [Apodospora peruviana]